MGMLYLFHLFFQDYVKLFMDLAEDSLGYVDWQPHIPKVEYNSFLFVEWRLIYHYWVLLFFLIQSVNVIL